MAGRDIGTYHLRVEFEGGRGYIETWSTGRRYERGTHDLSPLDARAIFPPWHSEEQLFDTMVFMYTDGNYGCDCNRTLFLARAAQEPEPDEVECGEKIVLMRLTAIRPDGDERVLWTKPGETR